MVDFNFIKTLVLINSFKRFLSLSFNSSNRSGVVLVFMRCTNAELKLLVELGGGKRGPPPVSSLGGGIVTSVATKSIASGVFCVSFLKHLPDYQPDTSSSVGGTPCAK